MAALGVTFTPIPDLSCGDPATGNLLIQGDNAAVLAQLQGRFAESVRCIYIDPPYNNQERYRHYADGLSHEEWLEQVTLRLRLLLPLLRSDGSIWISIDDREVHYLKVAADKVFGRANFLATVVWQQRISRENRKVFSNNHEYVLAYARNAAIFKRARGRLPAPAAVLGRYKNPDSDPRGPWQSVSATVQDGHATKTQFYELTGPTGKTHKPPRGRCWAFTKARMQAEIRAKRVHFGKSGDGVPRLKRFLSESVPGLTPETLWFAQDVGTSDSAKKDALAMFPHRAPFDTPKPEALIARIFEIATSPGDTVLDAYLGSGTTAAVAHKMDRRYIGIERGPHLASHCVARLRRVVDGEQGGVSRQYGWAGGGGFRFVRLARARRPRVFAKGGPLRRSAT